MVITLLYLILLYFYTTLLQKIYYATMVTLEAMFNNQSVFYTSTVKHFLFVQSIPTQFDYVLSATIVISYSLIHGLVLCNLLILISFFFCHWIISVYGNLIMTVLWYTYCSFYCFCLLFYYF